MRLRASQVARIRLVETEEDVETYRPALDALKVAIGDRQAELARLEGEPAIVGGKTPLALSGGRWREQGVGSVLNLHPTYTLPTPYLHPDCEVAVVMMTSCQDCWYQDWWTRWSRRKTLLGHLLSHT